MKKCKGLIKMDFEGGVDIPGIVLKDLSERKPPKFDGLYGIPTITLLMRSGIALRPFMGSRDVYRGGYCKREEVKSEQRA